MMDSNAAAARVAMSRERLRVALRAQRGTAQAGNGGMPGQRAAVRPWPERWLDGLGAARTTSVLVADAASLALLPVAQAHPLRLVTGAFVFGAVLAWSRPWSWLIKSAWFAGVVPHLLSRAMAVPPPPHE